MQDLRETWNYGKILEGIDYQLKRELRVNN
jgi:hypothetical protein